MAEATELRSDYTLKEAEKKEKKDDFAPDYMLDLKLKPEQKKDIIFDIKKLVNAIEKDLKDGGYFTKWRTFKNQYRGIVQDKGWGIYNLHLHLTKDKVDGITGALRESYTESDPMFSVSPRPEAAKQNVKEVSEIAEKQEEFLDFERDEEIPLDTALGKIFFSTVNNGLGILKLPWKYEEETVRDEEEYEGAEGLRQLEKRYPDVRKEYPGYVKRLENGKKLSLTVKYAQPIYNAPYPSRVKLENFRAPLDIDPTPDGFRQAKILQEIEQYTYTELLKKVNTDKFDKDAVEDIRFDKDLSKTDRKLLKDWDTKNYEVRTTIYKWDKNRTGEEESVVLWIEWQRKIILKAISYPYYHNRPFYIPFPISDESDGLYPDGMAQNLQDLNLALNAWINFILDSAYIDNTITPIVRRGTSIARQLAHKRWFSGLPMYTDTWPAQIDFYKRSNVNINGLLNLQSYLERWGDNISRISSYKTGQESPLDPNAPATKVMALLRESNINIKPFIKASLNSMNEVAYQILQLTYQMVKENKPFRQKKSLISQGEMFTNISRQEMRLRTNIEATAYSYDFDKLNQKQMDLAFLQAIGNEVIVRENPEAIYTIILEIIKGWSKKWKTKKDLILPSPDKFAKNQMIKAIRAVSQYVRAKQVEAQATGEKPNIVMEELVRVVSEATKLMTTQELAERQKDAEKSV